MKIPYFCCIGAELKRYAKDFDFMNQIYLYKVPTDDTIDEVFAQDYFKAIADTVLQDDILYVYETEEQILHTCRFDKANGHITAVQLASIVPELEPDRILVSDQDGKIAAGDLSLEYIEDTLSILYCTATLSSTVDTTTVVMLDELEAFANLDSRPSYKAAGALVIDANGNHGIIESVDTANETAVIVTTFAYNAVVKDSAETQVMQGGLETPELETDSLIVNGAATFEEAPITNDTTTYKSAASDSLVRKEQVEEVVQDIKTSSLTFIGYVSTTEPDSSVYAFNTGNLWLNSATMPTVFPFAQANIKEWNGTAWVAHSQDYTPANFDFFRNINDSEGYYWFAGQWAVMSTDMSTTYFQLNPISGKWEIKSNVNLPGAPTTTTPDSADKSTKIATTQFAHDFGQRYVSNCITEIPQDIKLELNNGTLTLKAGSKVYVPNGPGVFDVVNITADVTLIQGWASSQQFVLIRRNSDGALRIYDTGRCYSGTGSVSDGVYYNTNDNKVYVYDNGTLNYQASFPIALITGQSPSISSIDQVFNGFGYVGSTVFALSGVKGLIPNGRNADGSLKNTELSLESVKTFTVGGNGYGLYFFASSINLDSVNTAYYKESAETPTSFDSGYCIWYNTEKNKIYITTNSGSTWNEYNGVLFSYMYMTNTGRFDFLKTKKVFHALDYNDSAYIAHNAMPSDRYVDITIGASYSQYTAPADGYFMLQGRQTATGGFVKLYNGSAGRMATKEQNAFADTEVLVFLPVSKGNVIDAIYINTTITAFKFIYANGAQ